MSLKIDRIQLEIAINSDESRLKLNQLKDQMSSLRKELKGMKEDTEEYNKTSAKLKEAVIEYDKLIDKIGIAGLTMKELKQRSSELNMILQNLRPNSSEWKDLNNQLNLVNSRMKELRGQNAQQGIGINNIVNTTRSYIGQLSILAASFTGVAFGVKKAVDAFAALDDKMSDVMKTTGLTKKEVQELDDEFKKIDTRTSRTELLQLAQVAGKLGISAKEDVLGFVNAADKIKVALSEDLGGDVEESINQIGKLVDIFKVKDQFGIEDAMIKIGSTINSLGASSTASESYLVEFAKRVAGIAPSANISIQQVLGLAATLDQFGQTAEVSSTVISAILPDMFKNTADYAKIAGIDVKRFSDLLKTDSNEAFIVFLEGLNKNKGGLQELSIKLDSLNLEGKRSVGTLGVLANNTETLRKQQVYANQEFSKGTSLLNEYNTKNNNAQAILEKNKKVLDEITAVLGEKMTPAYTSVVSGVTYFMKTLVVLIEVAYKYKGLIIATITSIALYNTTLLILNRTKEISSKLDSIHLALLYARDAAQKILTFTTGVLTGKITLATAATTLWNAAISIGTGGIALLVAAVGGAIAYMVSYNKEVNNVTATQKVLNDVRNDTASKIAEERLQLNLLLTAAKSEKLSKEERLNAIKRLNDLSPQYLGNLSLETINTREAAKAVETYVASLEKKAKAEALYDKLQELEKQKLELRTKKLEPTTGQTLWGGLTGGGILTEGGTDQIAQMIMEKWSNDMAAVNKQIAAVTNEMLKSDAISTSMGSSGTQKTTTGAGSSSDLSSFAKPDKKKKFNYQEWKKEYDLELQRIIDDTIAETNNKFNKISEDLGIEPDKNVMNQVSDFLNEQKDTIYNDLTSSAKSKLDNSINASENDLSLTDNEKYQARLNAESEFNEEMLTIQTTFGKRTLEFEAEIAKKKLEEADKLAEAKKKKHDLEISQGVQEGIAATENAKTVSEAGKNVLNSIRSQVKAHLAEAIVTQIAQVISKVPWPFNMIAATAAAGALNMLFNEVVPQFATGKYPVMGASDGRVYNADYASSPTTGLYSSPTMINGLGLVGEREPEIVIAGPHVRQLQMNYPEVIHTIYATRQYADGKYPENINASMTSEQVNAMINLLAQMNSKLDKPTRSYISWRDLEDTQTTINEIEKSVS